MTRHLLIAASLVGALTLGAGAWPGTVQGVGLSVSADSAEGNSALRRTGPASLAALRLPPGSRHELLADDLWLHGMPARVLVFDAPLGAPQLIRFLSLQQPALADLNVLAGQVILSGRVGRDQWLVQMEGLGPRRAVGSISVLGNRGAVTTPNPLWLPAGGRLRLDVTALDQGVKVSQWIWQYAAPPARMAPRLEAGLRRDGWRRQSADGEAQWWIRGAARLRASLVPLESGSGLFVSRWTP